MKKQIQTKLSICKTSIARMNTIDTFQIKGGTLTDVTGANHGCTDTCPTMLATEASCGCKL